MAKHHLDRNLNALQGARQASCPWLDLVSSSWKAGVDSINFRVLALCVIGQTALGACASPYEAQRTGYEEKQREFESQRQRDIEAGRQACDLRGAAGVAPVIGKIPLSGPEWQNVPLAMLTLDRTPTAEEKLAIVAADDADVTICRPAKAAYLKKYDVLYEIVAVSDAADAAGRTVLADLYMGKLTYAQANRRFQQIQIDQNDTIAKITTASNARQASQIAEARAAAQAQINALTQAFIDSMPRTTTTTCIGGDGYANCTTH